MYRTYSPHSTWATCLTVLLLLVSATTQAQEKTWDLYAWIVDAFTRKPVEAPIKAELLLPDSTLTDSCTSRENNPREKYQVIKFTLRNRRSDYLLRLSHTDYDTTYVPLKLKLYKRMDEVHLGTLTMRKLSKSEKEMQLGEVTVKATRVKFFHRGDTIVYNADAFQLAEGSMLDGLISQLPGAELKDDGRLYVNGRFVDNLLLNGKDFFKGNNSIMLENLPAYTVKELKVYEEESELSRLLGMKADDGRYVMDVRLKRQYEIGWMGNTEWAAGTAERYLGRLFALRFTPQSRLSFYANLNNLNDTRKPGRNGDWSPSDLNGGLTATRTGGFDYNVSDKYQRYDLEGNAQATFTERDYHNQQERQNFLPGGDTYDRSWYDANDRNVSVSTGHRLKFYTGTVKANNYLQLEPQLNYRKYDNRSELLSGTFYRKPSDYSALRDSLLNDRTGTLPLLNHNRQEHLGKGHALHTGMNLFGYFAVPRTKDGINIEAYTGYDNSQGENFDRTSLRYASGTQDLRNRYSDSPDHGYQFYLSSKYFLRTGIWLITPRYGIRHEYRKTHRNQYRLDQSPSWDWSSELGLLPSEMENLMQVLDRRNSYSSEERITRHYADLIFMLNKQWTDRRGQQSQLYMRMAAAFQYECKQFSFHGATYDDNRLHRWLPQPSVETTWNTRGRKHELKLNWRMTTGSPSMLNLVDVTFDSDPLNIRKGNPHLKNTARHRIELNYRADKWLQGTSRMLSANAGHSRTKNAVAMGYVYDKQTGVRTYMPENVDGNWDVWTHVYFTTPLDKQRKWTLNTATQADFGHNVDLVSLDSRTAATHSIVRQLWARENLSIDYRFGKHKVGVRSRVGWSNVRNSREGFAEINAGDFDYGVNAQIRLPWNIDLGTDLTAYSHRGYGNAAMNTDELVWNARLSKSILHGSLTFTLDGFDILGNLSRITYTINGQGRTETWVNSLPRYAMLRVSYRLNRQPRNKK